jgi:hypothetical protein
MTKPIWLPLLAFAAAVLLCTVLIAMLPGGTGV